MALDHLEEEDVLLKTLEKLLNFDSSDNWENHGYAGPRPPLLGKSPHKS